MGCCHNSRIHESQSSSLACARALSGGLLGARGVGAVSAALGSACLPAVRTRSYADVAASACGGDGCEARACTEFSCLWWLLACAEVHQLQLG